MARTLLTVPKTARRGETVGLRTLIAHPMETGHRNDAQGRLLPRDIIRRFECRFDGELVFEAELYPAVSANPYLAFSMRAESSGTLSFRWSGDNGFEQVETVALTVA